MRVVTAPLALVKTKGGGIQYVYGGSPLPQDADPDVVKRLTELGMVADVADGADSPVETTPAGDAPSGEAAAGNADGSVDYASLEYSALQELAKQSGIQANQSRDALVAALSE